MIAEDGFGRAQPQPTAPEATPFVPQPTGMPAVAFGAG